MRASHLELMHDHVRAIHRAVTGRDPPHQQKSPTEAPPSFDELAYRFAELERVTRTLPFVAERVPPFSFAPPLDLIGTEAELIVELGVPGVDREGLDAVVDEDRLIISGSRSLGELLDGRVYLHAEMPRGPFRREIPLPARVTGRPRLEIDGGIVRVRLTKTAKSPLPQA